MLKKSVLLVNKYYAPSTGGIETAVKQYAHWYKDQGYEVLVLCCSATRARHSRRENIDGIDVLRTASFGNLLSVPLSPAFFWHFALNAIRAGIVHINLQFPLASLALFLTLKLIKGKTIVSYHCDVYRQRYLKKLTYLFDRFVARRADLLLCGSPALRDNSEVLANIGRKVEVLPYAIDLAHIERCLEQAPGVRIPEHFQSEGYCVFFGRLVTYKGSRPLETAFRQLMGSEEQINLVVFGAGPEEQRFRQLAEDYPHRVHFINAFLSDVDKYHLIRHSSMLLFPSVYYSEAFGIAQLDAMACARPIINCWLQTGVNWVAPHDEAALTVPADDVEKLAEAILSMQNDPSRRLSLGNAGLRRCQAKFSEAAVQADFNASINTLWNTAG